MNEPAELSSLVERALEQVETLADLRLSKIDLKTFSALTPEEQRLSLYVQGARDALNFLRHLAQSSEAADSSGQPLEGK